MPVRFLCPHCNQLLAVSSRKAGAQVNCPKCTAAIIVPEVATESTASSTASPQHFQTSTPAGGPTSEITAPTVVTAGARFEDADVEQALSSLVITESAPAASADAAPSVAPRLEGAERQTLLLPRAVIYFQGALLAAVALIFFLAGVWIGGFGNPSSPNNPAGPATASVRLDTLLQYQSENAAARADEGAIVLLLPVKQVIDRIPAAPLKPGGPALTAADPVMTQLQFLGGAFGRTDSAGKLQGLVVPQGKHHVLLLSKNARRTGEPRPQDLATLGNYLEGAADLLADRQYRLRTEDLTADTAMHHTFSP
jgi:phage FluMu protein Com